MFVTDIEIVGLVGNSVANFSHKYFGYLSYISFILLLYPLFKLSFSYIDELLQKIVLTVFLFVTLLILQGLLFTGDLSGEVGHFIIDTLTPYIGVAGIWIFVLIGLGISIYVIIQHSDKLVNMINKKLKFQSALKQLTFKSETPKKKAKKVVKEKVTVTEVGNTAEISIEELNENDIEDATIIENEFDFQETRKEKKVEVEKEVESPVDEKDDDFEDKKEYENLVEVKNTEKSKSTIVEELEENKKLLDDIEVGEVDKPKDFRLPKAEFFANVKKTKTKINEAVIDKKIKDLLEKLIQFRIEGDVVRTYTGPIVTTFEFKPAANVKVSKILNLQDDLAMALKAQTIRIQAPIPGKDVVGIEVPNEDMETIYMRELLESDIFINSKSPLTLILGKDIVGQPFITDLKKLPHLLIAGTTGSGKSVGINCMILSLLYKNSPDDLKLVMIDPKMLEFSMYNDIPHLLTPVITKPMEAINALANMVKEMTRRYTLMADTRTKNIENYNEKAANEGYEKLPYIVIIIDELADLMMTSGKEVELSVARLAQMARASGIHLIVATQRPSVDVVTGLIKANLPSRISYKVGQKVDSKIILDAMGAESLLGRGDMLFTPPGMSGLIRLHAPWSTEDEIDKVVNFLKEQREVNYDMSFVKDKNLEEQVMELGEIGELDELYEQAKLVVIQDQKASISYIQRRLKIGYNRSATIVEQLEKTGVLSAPNVKGNREILADN